MLNHVLIVKEKMCIRDSIGTGAREIGYLYGQYKRIKGAFENGVLTGKPMPYGGSLIRPEATGFGAVYFGKEVLAHFNDTYEGKTIACSGYRCV